MNDDFRSYLRFFRATLGRGSLVLLGVLPLVLLYVAVLRSIGEFQFSRDYTALREQQEDGPGSLFLSGFIDSGHYMKGAIAREIEPSLAIFGSSRVMQIRDRFFVPEAREGFYNLGGRIWNLNDLKIVLRELIDTGSPPETILLGVDWNWLQAPSVRPSETRLLPDSRWLRDLDAWWEFVEYRWDFWMDTLLVFPWAWRDPRLHGVLFSEPGTDPVSGRRLVGLGASLGGGYREDGSYRYWDIVQKPLEPLEARMREGYRRFDRGAFATAEFRPMAVEKLRDFLELCREHDIDVLVFLGPLPPPVHERYLAHPLASQFWQQYFPSVREAAEAYGYQAFDYTAHPGIADRLDEYKDWSHGSEVMHARLMLDLARRDDAPAWLRQIVDVEGLERALQSPRTSLDLYGD